MPLGQDHLTLWKRHKWTGVLTAGFLTVTTFSFASPEDPYWLLAGPAVWLGYLLGYYIDPDLDQANITAAEWRLMRDLGLIGSILTAWFLPYGLIMKHRSFISHFPGISTIIRYLWFLAFPPIAAFLWFSTVEMVPEYWPVLVGAFLGLTIADAVHYLADEGALKA